MIAQMSTPDMCLPIQYALTHPERMANQRVQTNLANIGTLQFEEPDSKRFPALDLARRAGEVCGTLPAVFNAANEVAVDAFCEGKLSFLGITKLVSDVMDQHQVIIRPDLTQILESDQWARQHAAVFI
jgi:1-deoxy-D-xylulose-5-phosphate reductoisomerase